MPEPGRPWDVPTTSSASLPAQFRVSGVRPGSGCCSGSRLLLLLLLRSQAPAPGLPGCIDFSLRRAHHAGVKRRGFSPGLMLLLSAALLWHGVLAGLPHAHHRDEPPRYLVGCEISASTSPVFHLHAISRTLDRGVCLACLVAGASAAASAHSSDFTPQRQGPEIDLEVRRQPGAHHEFRLPGSRGPPILL